MVEPESLSRRDVESAENNARKHYKRVAQLLEAIFAKLRQQKIKIEHKKVQIKENGQTVYEAIGGASKPKTNNITPELVDLLAISINQPQNLEGNVTISVGKQKVYEVENGKILVDKLGFHQQNKEAKPKVHIQLNNSLEGTGRELLEGAKKLLKGLWQAEPNGDMVFENEYYRFKARESDFWIEAKDGRGIVADSKGLTQAAGVDELTLLQNMNWKLEQNTANIQKQPQKEQKQERKQQEIEFG